MEGLVGQAGTPVISDSLVGIPYFGAIDYAFVVFLVELESIPAVAFVGTNWVRGSGVGHASAINRTSISRPRKSVDAGAGAEGGVP